MRIPGVFYGRAAPVRARARKLAKKLLATRDFSRIDAGELVDTSSIEGVLLLSPDNLWVNQDAFHCYALSLAVFDLLHYSEVISTMATWVLASLDEPWRFAGVLGDVTAQLPGDRLDLLRTFVDAAERHWPILVAEGNRFGPYVNAPEGAWQRSWNLRFALANLGITNDEFLRRVGNQ